MCPGKHFHTVESPVFGRFYENEPARPWRFARQNRQETAGKREKAVLQPFHVIRITFIH
jgi:hypothetical protein